MLKSRPEVIAAIPNYNMASSLRELLPSLLKQGYDGIYLLDDASTDDSVVVARSFENVTVVAGEENRGSGGNRNRVLDILPADSGAIIHFIDADTALDTPNSPEIARGIFSNPEVVAVGGLVRNLDGSQFIWNWGDRFTPQSWISMKLAERINDNTSQGPEETSPQWTRLRWLLRHTPNPSTIPTPRNVFWVSEANLLIRAATFREIGGFDPNLRVHDVFDVAAKLKIRGENFRFDPSIAVTHKAIDVRGKGRKAAENKAMQYLFHKHGWKLFF